MEIKRNILISVILLVIGIVMHTQYYSWTPPKPTSKSSIYSYETDKNYAERHRTKNGVPPYQYSYMPKDQLEARVLGIYIPLIILGYIIYLLGNTILKRKE